MKRTLAFLYGFVTYTLFLGVFLYAVGFVGNLVAPRTIDSGPESPLGQALLVNTLLLGLFAVQHSVMARQGFKRWWTRLVPRSVERSTYVLATNLVLALLFWQWRPIQGTVWQIEDPVGRGVMWGLYALGWALVLVSTFMISHAHLFGLQQVWQRLRGQPLTDPKFQTPGLYKRVRHPLLLGFVIAFWATPEMTWGHLLFAVATTGYILVGIQLEERDLIAAFGNRYRAYQEQVPRLLPRLRPARDVTGDEPA
ncbi:MAG: methanethiol S-methyltransferase [Thermoanaerobaculia bacterium]